MSCTPPPIPIPAGGVILSTSDFVNAQEILSTVSGAGGDPTLDEYNENIANGNNVSGKSGILLPNSAEGTIPRQTTLPPEISEKSSASNDDKSPGGNGKPVSGTTWDGNYDVLLSPNFKLRQFTVNAVFPYPLTDYNSTYTEQVRFNNLRNLSTNIAEVIFAKYGPFKVNSGIRNKTSTTSGLSQHIKGEAMDVQFPGWSYQRYWDAAQWVKNNIPFDQFIFEHSSNTGSAWLHLSYNAAGNRSPNDRTKVMTMYRNNYSPGLKRYG